MKDRKRIAILSSQLEEQYQKDFIEGFLKNAFNFDYDVCVFSTFQKNAESNLREVGENSIYSLINYSQFDGVVVMPDLIRGSGVMMNIENRLKEKYNGKVLFVDKINNTFPSIVMDHFAPIKRIVSHLIEDHGYKDIVFINGHKWHAFSNERERAFCECMKEHGLSVTEESVLYGDYWYDGGRLAIDEMVRLGKKMPEAFVCANDYMAIGAAETLVKHGYKIPEDVAIAGYDAVEEGAKCPEPITSIQLPARELGEHAASSIHNLINGLDVEPMINNAPIKYGTSCGCKRCQIEVQRENFESWNVSEDVTSYFQSINKMTEDLVLQSSFRGLIDSIQTYSYQIREFQLFDMMLNDVWVDTDATTEDIKIKGSFTEEMVPILHCGPTGKGADKVNYDARIKIRDMLPALSEEREEPWCFIFTPMFFDDIVFGYSVISYGNEIKSYPESYYRWSRSVMTGLECYRRNSLLISAQIAMNEIQITDSLTGMFNYEGFVKHAKPMVDRGLLIRNFISVLAVDLAGLDKINSAYGRAEGDKAIKLLADIVSGCADEGAMCCRLGNDEIAVAELSEEYNSSIINDLKVRIDEAINKYNSLPSIKYKLKIYTGSATERVGNLSEMEDLVNKAVSQKNGNKSNEMKALNNVALSEEDMEKMDVVKKILDDNLFSYHFQPIVSAKTGEIFAYEALMRATTKVWISPLEILKYAAHLSRLVDVEKATFFNVMDYINENNQLFEGKKVFINSIPGNQLTGSDAVELRKKIRQSGGNIVVELTEQTEADDETLAHFKERFEALGIESAVDDYGTGYSNIVNLLRYMPNYVKIDRMLLSGINENPQKQHFVKDIVIFAHDNNFKVLAEGIETSAELMTVIDLNVDLIQGYYTARPNAQVVQRIDYKIEEEIKSYNN